MALTTVATVHICKNTEHTSEQRSVGPAEHLAQAVTRSTWNRVL
jgi:hypothetical protein